MDKRKSLIDQIKEVDAKERKAEEEKLRAEREKRMREEKLAQDEYNKRLQLERVELMRLKQGVITEPELLAQEKEEEKIYTTKEKISNYFYHNKLYIILISITALIAFFMIHDIVTTVRPDASVLYISSNYELSQKSEEAEALFADFASDRNGDGKVYVSMLYVPIDDSASSDPQVYEANITKLIGELQTSDSTIIIGNKETLSKIELEDYLIDLTERYPDKENVNEEGILLSKTKFAEKLGISEIADDTVMCVQSIDDSASEKSKASHEFALSILDNLMSQLG